MKKPLYFGAPHFKLSVHIALGHIRPHV
jgi:hypothetical protein